jgi:hypothetical protein
VDVHEHLKLARRRRANQCLVSTAIVHPGKECQEARKKCSSTVLRFWESGPRKVAAKE